MPNVRLKTTSYVSAFVERHGWPFGGLLPQDQPGREVRVGTRGRRTARGLVSAAGSGPWSKDRACGARGGLLRHRPRLRRKLDALGATKRPSAPRFKLRAGLRLWMPMARVQRRGSRQHGINRRLYEPWGVRGECEALREVATTRSLQSNNGMQRTGGAGR